VPSAGAQGQGQGSELTNDPLSGQAQRCVKVGDGDGVGVGEAVVGDGEGDGDGFGDGDGEGFFEVVGVADVEDDGAVGGGENTGGGVGVGLGDGVGDGFGEEEEEGEGVGGWSERCWTSAAGWLGAEAGAGTLWMVVTASAVPAPATTITAMATAAALTALARRNSGIRSDSGIRSTVKPSDAGGLPDGHSAASSNAASPRCDRPRFSQSGPYAPRAAASRAATRVVPSVGRWSGSLAIPAVTRGRSGSGTGSSGMGATRCW
jgi:hypothetical protein